MDDNHEPATKADIAAVKAAVKDDIAALRNELIEVFRDGETRLLKAFYNFAESNQKRLTENERESSGLKERMGVIERRVTEIEKRLNMPPTA